MTLFHNGDDWAFAQGLPTAKGRIRVEPEDFRVDETLGFFPDGEGAHRWLWVEKRGCNTEWVARQLARVADVHPRDVGFAGLKDRHAVTRQWFSVPLPAAQQPDWAALEAEGIRVLEAVAHSRKLRRGTLQGNRFALRISRVEGDRDEVERRLERIRSEGVPNYFGPQRFGREMGNLTLALELFRGEVRLRNRNRRSLALSAARSWLFNELLSRRVARGDWNRLLPGDVAALSGSNSVFKVGAPDDELMQRLRAGDIHPTGPLWGRGELMSQGDCRELETAVADAWPELAAGLEEAGLRQERRPLRLLPGELEWCWDSGDLNVQMVLPAGAYATTVLREALVAEDAAGEAPA